MRKPDFCLYENKGADQLRSNCEADQRLSFHYTDSTSSLLLKFQISSFQPASVTAQVGLCQTSFLASLLINVNSQIHFSFQCFNSIKKI